MIHNTHLSHQEGEALGCKVADVLLLVGQQGAVEPGREKQVTFRPTERHRCRGEGSWFSLGLTLANTNTNTMGMLVLDSMKGQDREDISPLRPDDM